ncbi:MAG: carbohydrate kinase family protein [Promethearchaeota archaeon]
MPLNEGFSRFEIVVIGHLTIDQIEYNGQTRYAMGGPPAYAMVAPALGMKRIGIISRIGRDFPDEYLQILRDSGLNLDGLLTASTTTLFVNRYDGKGDRIQHAEQVAASITVEDIPSQFWNTAWMHLSPVLKEVDSCIIPEAHRRGVKVSVDVQGFIRNRVSERDSRIIAQSWESFSDVAPQIDILKADVNEICQLTQQTAFDDAAHLVFEAGCPLVLITWGQRGAFLYSENSLKEIPTIPSYAVVDHTGSGDVFSISFLFEFQRTGRPLWSAFFAATTASFNIETPGPTEFPDAEAVTSRLRRFLSLPGNRKFTDQLLNEPGPTECPL